MTAGTLTLTHIAWFPWPSFEIWVEATMTHAFFMLSNNVDIVKVCYQLKP
jgi:hypothetical protein